MYNNSNKNNSNNDVLRSRWWTSQVAAWLLMFFKLLLNGLIENQRSTRTDGKVNVEDELHNFLAVKIKTLSQGEIVLLATNTFNSEGIEALKFCLNCVPLLYSGALVLKGSKKMQMLYN